MRIEATTKIDLKYNTTVDELKKVLDGIPPTATMRVDMYKGDPSYTHLIFSWSEER
jgi:hypothetical protein